MRQMRLCANAAGSSERWRAETMHPDTLAALRLLMLALGGHPEDLAVLQIYGQMPKHLEHHRLDR